LEEVEVYESLALKSKRIKENTLRFTDD